MLALAGWLSWLEHHPIHQKFEGLVPGQGTYLGRGFDTRSGCMWEATGQCFSLTLMVFVSSLSLPLSLKSIKTYPRVRIRESERERYIAGNKELLIPYT